MYDNTAGSRNMNRINISKNKQGDNFIFEYIWIFAYANSSDTQTALN